jgi:hypothetical protein
MSRETTFVALEHFQAWWNTKRLRIMRQNKDLEQNFDSEKTHFALRLLGPPAEGRCAPAKCTGPAPIIAFIELT